MKAIGLAASFIILELAALALLNSSSKLQNIWFNRASHQLMGALWGRASNIGNYFRLTKINDSLARENARLGEELMRLKADNAAAEFNSQQAKVVKFSYNSQRNYIVLDKGSIHGIEPSSGIVSEKGVVGIIDAVSGHYSYGRTLMNTGISVSARLGREGLVGSLNWDGKSSHSAVLHGIPLYFKVETKDTVWTSGYSNIFPSGIALGLVSGTSTQNGATQDISVDLFQDFAALKYVTVLHNPQSEEIKALEEQGGMQ
ncbi:MAG: rod shape-determining protein MreC [Candidatus Cryptobacteroides sp.]